MIDLDLYQLKKMADQRKIRLNTNKIPPDLLEKLVEKYADRFIEEGNRFKKLKDGYS